MVPEQTSQQIGFEFLASFDHCLVDCKTAIDGE
jgi:hypothetical protein